MRVNTPGYDTVAELRGIEGRVMVNRGDRYIDGEEGMEFKKGNRVMALEGSSTRVGYYWLSYGLCGTSGRAS